MFIYFYIYYKWQNLLYLLISLLLYLIRNFKLSVFICFEIRIE